MTTPITDRELPEEIMSSLLRLEEEAYRAGQHGCCEEGLSKMANPSCFGGCKEHGARSRASLTLLCHALSQWAEEIVEEAARVIGPASTDRPLLAAVVAENVRDLARPCPKCKGLGAIPGKGHCDCSRGKAYAHWERLNEPAPAPKEE